MKTNIIKYIIFAFMFFFLPLIIKADEKIYAPNNWNCFLEEGTLRCKSSETEYIELTKGNGNVYCSLSYKTCWDYKTGLAWFWLNDTGTVIHNPQIKDEEKYDLHFEDLESKFQKYPSYYYETNWELQPNGNIVGIWDYETSAGSNKSCSKKFGVTGDFYEGRCYYSIYVDNYNGSKCKQISGVEGKIQNFLGKSYCIYNLFGYEKDDCNKESYYGITGIYLTKYGSCIGGFSESANNSDNGNSQTNNQNNDKISCVDSKNKSSEPVFYDDGSYGNAKHYYYFCPITHEIMGNTDVCLESEFLSESEVIEKFGKANSGHHALYCKTTVVNGVPPQEQPPSTDNNNENDTDTDNTQDRVEINLGIWGDLPTVKCGNTTIPSPIPQIIRIVVVLLKIAMPLMLIILGSIDIVKAVIASDEKKINESQSRFLKRLIPAALVFLVITIIQFLIGIIADNQNEAQTLIKCIDCMVSDSSKCE